MTNRQNPQISSRRTPKQARSADLVAAILEAAVQVLRSDGATRFTSARVAERAGVSVGSLYQYFPNKAAILFRLQSDEWRQTAALLQQILADATLPPPDRLRRLAHTFLQSECDEAAIRGALSDAAPLYRDTPEAQEARAGTAQAMQAFITATRPDLPPSRQALLAELLIHTLSGVGKQFSARPRTAEEITAYADMLSGMLCAALTARHPDPPTG